MRIERAERVIAHLTQRVAKSPSPETAQKDRQALHATKRRLATVRARCAARKADHRAGYEYLVTFSGCLGRRPLFDAIAVARCALCCPGAGLGPGPVVLRRGELLRDLHDARGCDFLGRELTKASVIRSRRY